MNNKEKPKKQISVARDNSPAEMIRMAVSGGADLEDLEKLLTLQERWEKNEARKAYHKAMSEFKENPPKINKDKTVKYKEVKYNHASLANVVEKITAELSKHGLSASWSTQQNGAITVTCRITHVLGHSEETTLRAGADTTGSKNSIQAIGSTVTYLQRYTLLSALGLATYDQDDDGKVSTKPEVDIPKGKDEVDADPIPEINPEEARSLMETAKESGHSGEQVIEYMKTLNYPIEDKTVLQVLEQLNTWDYGTCLDYFGKPPEVTENTKGGSDDTKG